MGDGPGFRDDDSNFQLSGDAAQEFAIKMTNARRGAKPKKARKPSKAKIARGLAAQAHMNATQFREPEDRGPNPGYVPAAPGTSGGPPLPRTPTNDGQEDSSTDNT